MMKKLLFCLVLAGASAVATISSSPISSWRNKAGQEVLVYGIGQQADEAAIEALINELKELPSKGVSQLLVDDISTSLLAKINSGFAKLCSNQQWNEIGLPVTYFDVRVIERITLILRGLAMLSAMDYMEGSHDLEQIYQQWGFTVTQAKTLKDRYQPIFAPTRQQIGQTLGAIGNRKITDSEAQQIQDVYKKFEHCFINHLFIIFALTRKALVAEHNALLQEIAGYKDGEELVAEYKNICDQFKKTAPWLQETAEETVYGYTRRSDLLSGADKNEIEALKKKNPTQVPAIEDLNLMKIVLTGVPLIAIRAIHCIINAQQKVALFILDSAVQESINGLLKKAGYSVIMPNAQ